MVAVINPLCKINPNTPQKISAIGREETHFRMKTATHIQQAPL
jgi:hypothetical protein